MQVSGLPSAFGEGGSDIKQIKESKEGGDTQKRISRARKKKTNSLPVEKERVIRNDILNGEKKRDKDGTVRQLHGQSSSMQRRLSSSLKYSI